MSDEQTNPPSSPPDPPSAGQGGPYVPNSDERLMGMLIHVVAIAASIVGPLILWIIKRKESRFIDHNGKEALNFQFTVFLVSGLLSVSGILFGITTKSFGAMFVVTPLLIIIGIATLVCEIRSAFKASRGEWPRYPVSIRFLR